MERAEPREDGLHERVARGRVRAAPVHVRDEERAPIRRRASEDADLREDDLGGRVQVRGAVRCGRAPRVIGDR